MQDILGRQDNDGGLEIKDSWRMQVNEEPLELVTRKSEERGKRRILVTLSWEKKTVKQ